MSGYFLIVDLEATCSDDGSVPREEMEIIEIGAVMLNRSTWEVDSEYQKFIKPVRHPILKRNLLHIWEVRKNLELLKLWNI